MQVPASSPKQFLRVFVIPALVFASAELIRSQELNVPLHAQMLTQIGRAHV